MNIMNNNSVFNKLWLGTLICLLIIGIGSCTPNNQGRTDIQTQTAMPSRTPGSIDVSTATTIPKPTLTKTELLVATTTWTPLPTIEPNNIDAFVDSMNTQCELPCWGSIVPGNSSEMEAKHLLSSFGTIIESTSIYFEYREKPAVIDLIYKDGLVSSLNLPPELSELHELNDLLSRYGIPKDVKIEIIPETADGTSWFFLAIFYPQEGFFAIFSGEGKTVDSKISACLEGVSPDLYLVEANKYSLQEMTFFLDRSLRNVLKPLSSLTELNINQFYDTFNQPKAQCLITTVNMP